MTRHPVPRGGARAGRDERAPLRWLLAGALALTAPAAAGCSGGGRLSVTTAGPAVVTHSPAPDRRAAGTPVLPGPAEPALSGAAARYLQARENAIGYTHPAPRDWLRQARPAMTATGWSRLSASLGDSGGFPAATARTHRWSVQATVACQPDPDAPPATPTVATLVCAVTDRTVDPTGHPVQAIDLPGLWPYTGPQQPALLVLRRLDGGRWLVDDDETGRAG